MAPPMRKIVRPAEELSEDDSSECGSDVSTASSNNPVHAAPADPNAANATDQQSSVICIDLSGRQKVTNNTLLHISTNNMNLQELDISECKNVDDDGIGHLSRMAKLRILNLAGCEGLTDSGLRHLARRCKRLRVLDLRRCRNISQDGLLSLAYGWPRLTHLYITGCSGVGSKGLHHVANGMHQLRCLMLEEKHVSSDGLIIASKTLKNLRDIRICSPDGSQAWLPNIVSLQIASASSSS